MIKVSIDAIVLIFAFVGTAVMGFTIGVIYQYGKVKKFCDDCPLSKEYCPLSKKYCPLSKYTGKSISNTKK